RAGPEYARARRRAPPPPRGAPGLSSPAGARLGRVSMDSSRPSGVNMRKAEGSESRAGLRVPSSRNSMSMDISSHTPTRLAFGAGAAPPGAGLRGVASVLVIIGARYACAARHVARAGHRNRVQNSRSQWQNRAKSRKIPAFPPPTMPRTLPKSIDETHTLLGSADYVADRSLATALYLSLAMQRPL